MDIVARNMIMLILCIIPFVSGLLFGWFLRGFIPRFLKWVKELRYD